MFLRLTIVGLLTLALVAGAQRGTDAQGSPRVLDAAFTTFWGAGDPAAAAAAARQVLAASQDFSTLVARLRAGKRYAFGRVDDLVTAPTVFAPAATISRARKNIYGLWHPYLIMVPPTYNPAKPYPVRVYLQGDTSRPASSAESGAGWPDYDALARDDSIVVFPGAWNGFAWWDASQPEHIAAVLDELKRGYNVDENRVYLLGSSDGGTGIYYHAMVAPNPFAAFLPFNGDPSVLADPQARVEAQLHPSNLANRQFYVVHGARDQIFPVASVAAWLGLFESAGAHVAFNVKANYGHETRWWSEEERAMDAFITAHPRDPLPDRVVWETAQADRFNRASWVLVDELGTAADETAEVGPNTVLSTSSGVGIGVWADAAPRGVQISLVQPESAAADAGLRDGDVVQQIDGIATPSFAAVETALRAKAGGQVPVVVLRGGERVTAMLQIPPADPNTPQAAFPHPRQVGRVQVERSGNAVDVRTRGVRRLTLLLSPDKFDFSQPITVTANGTVAFAGKLQPSAGILMKWAARDNDRTMLFGQELEIRLP